MTTPFNNAHTYADFLNELLFKLDPTVVDHYFAPEHTFTINEKPLHNGLFKQRIAWIGEQVANDKIDLGRSHIRVIDFFLSEDRKRLFEQHETLIFRPRSNKPTRMLVDAVLTFNEEQKIIDMNLVDYVADRGDLSAEEATSGANASVE